MATGTESSASERRSGLVACLAGRALSIAVEQNAYQDDDGTFAIDTVELIGGDLPQRQRRLVEAWAELHQPDLFADRR